MVIREDGVFGFRNAEVQLALASSRSKLSLGGSALVKGEPLLRGSRELLDVALHLLLVLTRARLRRAGGFEGSGETNLSDLKHGESRVRRRERFFESALGTGLEAFHERLRILRLHSVGLRLGLGASGALREGAALLRPRRLGPHVFPVQRGPRRAHVGEGLLVLCDVHRELLELFLLGGEVGDDAGERAVRGGALFPRALSLGVRRGGDGGVSAGVLAGRLARRRLDVEGHGRHGRRGGIERSLERADPREERVAFAPQPLHGSHGVSVHGGGHDGFGGDGGLDVHRRRRRDRSVRSGS